METARLLVYNAARLKDAGFRSPYLKSFVVARCNPLRFRKTATGELDAILGQMLEKARKFDVGKVKAEDLQSAAGPAPSADE